MGEQLPVGGPLSSKNGEQKSTISAIEVKKDAPNVQGRRRGKMKRRGKQKMVKGVQEKKRNIEENERMTIRGAIATKRRMRTTGVLRRGIVLKTGQGPTKGEEGRHHGNEVRRLRKVETRRI